MQETTYFQPQPKKVIITKKHFAAILFAWWLLVQFIQHVINPSAKFVYKSLFEEGSMKVYGWNKKDEHKNENDDDRNNERPVKNQKNKRNTQYEEQKGLNTKSRKSQSLEQDIESSQNIEKDLDGPLSKADQFKIHFKVKSKGKNLEDIKQKAAEQSLKLAMQEFLFIKKKHESH